VPPGFAFPTVPAVVMHQIGFFSTGCSSDRSANALMEHCWEEIKSVSCYFIIVLRFFPFRFNLSVAGKFIERISLQSGKGTQMLGGSCYFGLPKFRDTS
jgi:hypothetical protein